MSNKLTNATRQGSVTDRYKETFETWNKVASLYQDKFMDLELYDKTYDFICDAIATVKAKIFEIGCGPGNITRYLLSKRPDFDIFGIDIAPNMIELAKKNNPTARFEVMDCRNIDEVSPKFDGIICGFCLPYLSPEDAGKFLSDCANSLNERGLLYVSFVPGDPANSGYQTGSSGDRTYFYYQSIEEVTHLLHINDFAVLKTFEIEYSKPSPEKEIHTVIVAEKCQEQYQAG